MVVAAIEAEIGDPADAERDEVLVDILGRQAQLGEEIERRQGLRIPHERQVQDILDRPVPQERPEALAFETRFRLARVRGPVDAASLQASQGDGDRALAVTEHRVKIDQPTRDGTLLDCADRSRHQSIQTLFGGCQRARADLARAQWPS
ncbi:hypothetical protein FQV39_31805 (plasmid) [Bosea sp. F3-2]|nr:hypothetical protein FQV39_31805 [Bosea sp. F3-2]